MFQKGYGRHLDKIQTRTSPDVQALTVKALIGRLLPERAAEFDIAIEPGLIGEENGYFQVALRTIKKKLTRNKMFFSSHRLTKQPEVLQFPLKDRLVSWRLGDFIII